MSLNCSGSIGLSSWRLSWAGVAVVLASLASASRSDGRDVFASSWEGPASESDGTEFIYNGTNSVQEPTHYFDGWFPYPIGNSSGSTYPFGNTDLRTYTTDSHGVTSGTQGLVISRNSAGTYWALQRNFGNNTTNQTLFTQATSAKLDVTFDQAMFRNFAPDANQDNGFGNFVLAINTPLGYVEIPRNKLYLDTTTFQTKPTGNAETVTPANPNYSTNALYGEWDNYKATAAGNPVETHSMSWNLYQPAFVVTSPAANYNQYTGMQYMKAINQITQNGTSFPADFYFQLNIGLNTNYGAYFPNSGDASTPDGNAVSFILDNFRIQSNIKGDFNQDGNLTNADIQSMLYALINKSAYEAANDLVDSDLNVFGDFDGDGQFTSADIPGMLALLTSSSAAGALSPVPVPEPNSQILLALAMPVLALGYRRRFK